MVNGRTVFLSVLIVLSCSAFSGCSVNLIEPITVQADTEDTADSSSESVTDAPIDTATASDTGTETATETDTGTETNIDTGTDSETDTFIQDAVPGLLGFAAVDALGQNGTTGGLGDTDPIVATSGAEMQAAIDAKGSAPLIVHVDRRITHTGGRVVVSGVSDVSIIGTSDAAELDGFGITVTGGSNVIIQNLKIHHVQSDDKDVIRIADQSHHVWVDHCELYNDRIEPAGTSPFDSLLDISVGSDYVTISWNRIRDHVKSMYVGASDADTAEDQGKLHITFHHNRFTNIGPGTLSVRFGPVHLFNNIFELLPVVAGGTGGTISARMGACVRLENNRFVGYAQPTRTDQSGNTLETLGALELLGNDYGDYTTLVETPTCVLDTPYGYEHTLNSASILDQLLEANVGPQP